MHIPIWSLTQTYTKSFPGDKQQQQGPDHADVMTFLTRFVDAASKLTNHDGHDILGLESRDNDASGPALEEGSVEEENQVWNMASQKQDQIWQNPEWLRDLNTDLAFKMGSK